MATYPNSGKLSTVIITILKLNTVTRYIQNRRRKENRDNLEWS